MQFPDVDRSSPLSANSRRTYRIISVEIHRMPLEISVLISAIISTVDFENDL